MDESESVLRSFLYVKCFRFPFFSWLQAWQVMQGWLTQSTLTDQQDQLDSGGSSSGRIIVIIVSAFSAAAAAGKGKRESEKLCVQNLYQSSYSSRKRRRKKESVSDPGIGDKTGRPGKGMIRAVCKIWGNRVSRSCRECPSAGGGAGGAWIKSHTHNHQTVVITVHFSADRFR